MDLEVSNNNMSTDRCWVTPQITRFIGPTWGSSGPQMGPMLAPWTLLSGTNMHLPSFACITPSHNFYLRWTIVNRNHWNKFQWNFIQNASYNFQTGKWRLQMASILSRFQCVGCAPICSWISRYSLHKSWLFFQLWFAMLSIMKHNTSRT